MKQKTIAVITIRSLNGDTGGAERLYEGLIHILNTLGVKADRVSLESDESCFEAIQETYLQFYDLALSGYDGVISTKAPSYIVRHSNHVCYLVHTMRVFYDMFDNEFPSKIKELEQQRKFIHLLDKKALSYPRVNRIFSIGNEVSKRLYKYTGLESEVLHPGLTFDDFRQGAYRNYLFLPGRLHRWKRVGLVIEAMKFVNRDIHLKICGSGEDEEILRAIAQQDERIEFLGRVPDQNLRDLYSNALAVPFTPLREDYGYVTLEAFRSKKPVITCMDSGEPAHFVKDGLNGFVCSPNPAEIARKIEWLFDNPKLAVEMGERAYESIQHITWENVGSHLIESLKL